MPNVINFLKKNILFFFFILFFSHNYKFFFNFYDLMNIDYEKRLIRFHGYCGKESFGFIDRMNKKHDIKNLNVKILNYADFPPATSFFFKLNKENSDQYLIILNKKYLELLKDDNFLQIWRILDIEENCYLLKKR
jgi:hypothetical protein